ncbi:MAG: hypothetical protein MZU91_06880 [Desulfosudis oleivorans]|nr:hypothetical protein [Desulfosudis oleivorans]
MFKTEFGMTDDDFRARPAGRPRAGQALGRRVRTRPSGQIRNAFRNIDRASGKRRRRRLQPGSGSAAARPRMEAAGLREGNIVRHAPDLRAPPPRQGGREKGRRVLQPEELVLRIVAYGAGSCRDRRGRPGSPGAALVHRALHPHEQAS